VQLRLIEPGKPNQNAYIESSNRRLRDECLNEHWFLSLLHAQTEIENWRRKYSEERPKNVLGGMHVFRNIYRVRTRPSNG
jgi:transposase InsO family protein